MVAWPFGARLFLVLQPRRNGYVGPFRAMPRASDYSLPNNGRFWAT